MKKSGFTTAVILIVAVLTLLVGAYLYWQRGKATPLTPAPTPATIPSSTPEPTPLPTPEIINLDQWRESSYSKTQPFTFKYPPGWEEIQNYDVYFYEPKDRTTRRFHLELTGNTTPLSLGEVIRVNSTGARTMFLRRAKVLTGSKEAVMLTVEKKNIKGIDSIETNILIDGILLREPFLTTEGVNEAIGRLSLDLSAPAAEVSQQEIETLAQQIASTFKIKEEL